jgi:hypothetical protein
MRSPGWSCTSPQTLHPRAAPDYSRTADATAQSAAGALPTVPDITTTELAGLAELKQLTRATWGAGNLREVARRGLWEVGERIVGQRVRSRIASGSRSACTPTTQTGFWLVPSRSADWVHWHRSIMSGWMAPATIAPAPARRCRFTARLRRSMHPVRSCVARIRSWARMAWS